MLSRSICWSVDSFKDNDVLLNLQNYKNVVAATPSLQSLRMWGGTLATPTT